ncbi:MAG: PIN domain-containing protein [Defluviitaleaceae bacterium]|nr:PIN domain-containing protein [Defluviitaleaceae bacterium]
MILVDTSVLVDVLKGVQNEKSALFKRIIEHNLSYGISEYTYLELLQGARNHKEYSNLNEYLLDMTIYMLSKTVEIYEHAASMYFNLRRQGVIPRSTIDVLIALTAIEHGLTLLHNDKDFDAMVNKIPELRSCS